MANTGPLVSAVCDLVQEFTGITTAGEALKRVQAGFERVLLERQWACLEPMAELALAETITGTATGVYSAATELTTITATAAIFSPCQIGETITIADVDDMVIASYTSDTIVVATAGENFADKAVSLRHPGIYALPAGFGGITEPLVYIYSSTLARPELKEVSPHKMFAMWRDGNAQNAVQNYAIVPVTFVKATGQLWNLIVHPRPEDDRIVRYRYRIQAYDLTDGAEYFPGGTVLGAVYRAAALAEAEALPGKKVGIWEKRYGDAVTKAAVLDSMFITDDGQSLATDVGGGLQ